MFPSAVADSGSSPQIAYNQAPLLLAIAGLVESVPAELLVLRPTSYAELIASLAYLRALPEALQAARSTALPLKMQGFDLNCIALIHRALVTCPDEAPPSGTTELAFILDEQLRNSIRLDLGAAHRDLSAGEWKGATVLAGSAAEALLLWALQTRETASPGALQDATRRLVRDKKLSAQPGEHPERWNFFEAIEVAAELQLINAETADLVRLAKNFRNLIHPGRVQRLGQACDKPTALAALAAAEAIARDLGRTPA
jgi:hypothetical protein